MTIKKYKITVLKVLFLKILVLLFVNTISAQTTRVFDVPGTYTFTLPAGTTSATVEVWGGGGGAGASTALNGGGGGGGGAYARTVFTNPVAGTYTVVVGAAGIAGSGNSKGGNGGDSYVNNPSTIMAKGGLGGLVGGAGGTGGTAAASVGTFKFSGGNGGAGGGSGGGGGGSSAGTTANGTNGTANTGAGGIAPSGGGNGGNGTAGTGQAGFAPGGGGGGSNDIIGTAGAPGGAGKVVITYTCSVGPVSFTLGASSVRCQAASSVTYTATSANATNISYALDAASLAAGNTINSATGQVTFVASWTGTSTVTASATSAGCTGATSTHTITTNGTAPAPIFTLGTSSQRCSGAGTTTYTASTSDGASIIYTLDAASLAAGNTINPSTGQVTYLASWVGPSTITAQSNGCGNPTASHTVTRITAVAAPVFTLGATSNRCRGAGTGTYSATSSNATSISYSLDAASILGGNTINSSTGLVTFSALYTGQVTVTATATACGFTATATHTISNEAIIAVNDTYTTSQGTPIVFNVLNNDLCNIDTNSVTLDTNPVGGFLQQGANGQFTYVSFGSFVGDDTFTYRVCTPGPIPTCTTATVTIRVTELLDDPCSEATRNKTYYLPFPENDTQLRQSLISAASSNLLTTDARTIVSISVPYPKTILYYDHWEDGYEAELENPAQSTTLVWGDGNTANGTAPGYPTDVIPPGGVITIDNSFPWIRPTSTVVFDGKDKIRSTANVSVVKVSGDNGLNGTTPLFNVQNVKTNVADTSRFGRFFVLPFGENVTAGPTSAFRYTGLFVRALEDNTTVQLDYNGDGASDVTSPVLNQGQVWFYNGTGGTPGVNPGNVNQANDIKAGARVSADKNVGIDLVFGGIDTYGTRNIPVYPSQYYGSTYYSPVYSTDTTAPVYLYFVNPNSTPITINWARSTAPTTGSFTVPANNGISFFNANAATATRFTSADGKSFTAVGIVDADTAGTAYDWAFNLIPKNRLSSFVNLAWAPGTSDNSANYNPVWITPSANTTIYVKYDGNVTIGPNISPCGARYDVSYTLNELQTQLILDPDNNNTGMAIYNCDDVPMAASWGLRPFGGTPTGSPSLDVGYTIDPKCLTKLVFTNDDRRSTLPSTPININVASNDDGFLAAINPLSVTLLNQPSSGTAVVNPDGTVTYTPAAGFTGTVSFQYQICAQSPDQNVCEIATVYVDVKPNNLPGANTICGNVYNDLNYNGTPQVTDPGLSTIPVQLYDDVNRNGLLDAGEPLLQTINSQGAPSLGYFQFNITQDNRYLDQFNTNGANNGSNGTRTWANNWTEIVENNGFATGNIQVITNQLQIQGNAAATSAGAFRTLDLSAPGTATLTLDYNKSAFSSATTDWVDVQVSSTASGPWRTLRRYSGTAAQVGFDSFDITPEKSATTTIRFIESSDAGFATTERVFFDNIQVQAILDKNYIVKLQEPISNNLSQTSLPVQYAIAFVGVDKTNCGNTFGLFRFPVIDAIDQTQTINPGSVGLSVLRNDTIDRGSAGSVTVGTTGNATIRQVSTTNSGVNIDASGNVEVASGTPAGTYTITYEICTKAEPIACDTAVETVVVPPTILAIDGAQTLNPGTTGSSVVANDAIQNGNAGSVTLGATGNSTISQISTTNAGVNIDDDGNVVVNANTPSGVYTITYQICTKATPVACSTATEVVTVNNPVCYKPAQTAGTTLDTNHGITALGRAGDDNSNWPMVRKGAWTVLEAKTKGFVVNRLTDAQVSAIPSADLREGMMVYNITQDCLQINIDGTATGWRCFNTQTCPDL